MTFTNYTDTLIEEFLDEGEELFEYTKLQGWQDAIDQIETEEDAYRIPQWVLNELGLTRDAIMPKTQRTYQKAAPNPDLKKPADKDYTDNAAASSFWNWAKKGIIDYDSFHKAYDNGLKAVGCPDRIWYDTILWSGSPEVKQLRNSKTWSIIKGLDATKSSVRALRKLWALQFKDNATALLLHQKREQEKQTAAEYKNFCKEVLDKIREKITPDMFKTSVENTAKQTIENPKSEFDAFTWSNAPYIGVRWQEYITPFMSNGEGVVVKFPQYNGNNTEFVHNNTPEEIADYFISEFKKGNWADESGNKDFPDGE